MPFSEQKGSGAAQESSKTSRSTSDTPTSNESPATDNEIETRVPEDLPADSHITISRKHANDPPEREAARDSEPVPDAEHEAASPGDGSSKRRRRRHRRRQRRGGADEALPTADQASPDQESDATDQQRTSLRDEWKAWRDARKAAQYAIAKTRHDAGVRIAVAKRRSQSEAYLHSKIPAGDWTKREVRQHRRTARKNAIRELKNVKKQAAASVRQAQEQVKSAARSRRAQRRRERRELDGYLAYSRLRSVRLGLATCWLGLGGFTWHLWRIERLQDQELFLPLAATSAAILLFSMVPWKRLLHQPLASLLIFLWLAALAGAMVATAPFHESALGLFIGAAWITIYAAVLLAPVGYAFSASATLIAYGSAISLSPDRATEFGLVFQITALAATALIVGIVIFELRSQATQTVRRLHGVNQQRAELRKREAELLQLYEVSRTIGLGEDLREVLPELVARTAGYVEAKVGLVVLHRPEEEILAALSPIWVAGQALEAERYEFPVDGTATAATVFGKEAAYMSNDLDEVDLSRDRLLADLGVERVAAVPLRVEGRTIGVLIVGDKATDFTIADLEALELLATGRACSRRPRPI